MEIPKAADTDLVHRTLAGDPRAFEELVGRYQGRMFGAVRQYLRNPVEVEDLVQETFLKAFGRLSSFQHQSSFSTWMYRIAVNTVLDFLKRRGRSPVQSVEDPELVQIGPTERVAPDADMERKEIQDVTQNVLAELPEIFRTVLILREFEDLAYQEIADTLGISIGTVESRLFRARARFKDKLLTMYPEFGADL